MLELLFALLFDGVLEFVLWLIIEVFGFTFASSRALIYTLSFILITVFIFYFGPEKVSTWLRAGTMVLIMLAADFIILPWLERRSAAIAARRSASRRETRP